MRQLKSRVNITLDDDVLAHTRRLAEASDRSVSQYINLLLLRHLEAIQRRESDNP